MKRLSGALALLCGVAIVISACGDDDNGGSNGETPGITPQNTPIPQDPLPTVEGRVVTSQAKAYSVTYPEGWEPRYNLVNAPGQKLDAYFGPARTDGGFRASISVGCEQIAPTEDSRAYYERKRAVTEASADGEIVGPETLTISGVPAFQIEYRLDARDQEVRKIDIFAAKGTCGYTVSLASSPEELAQHLATWQAFLNTLTFL
jgi:hypothetical protein